MNSQIQPPSFPTRDELIAALAERDRELAKALERQTATADILKVIASSPSDAQPVFQAIADSAKRLLRGRSGFVVRYIGNLAHLAAATSIDPDTDALVQATWPRPMVGNPIVEAVQNGQTFQASDVDTIPDDGLRRAAARQGWRSALTVPLANKGVTIGSVTATRAEPGVFAADDVQLMRTFADQAVIAIENTRLFNETQEALERQTATADVLGAIGRSVSDAAPVFEEILNACQRLFGSEEMGIYTVGADEMVRVAAWRGARATEVSKDVSPLADSITGKMIRERRTHHIPDLKAEPNLSPMVRERAERLGSASLLYAPMLWEDRGLGSILVVRTPPRPFTERETDLLRTFADQAAIAIQNARLFNETKQALERQTATAEILKVIASSPTDVQPVFQAIADSAKRLLAGHSALVTRYTDGLSHIAAFTPISPEADAALMASYPRPLKGNPTYEAVRDGFPFKLPDVEEADPEGMRKQARGRGWRSLTALPLQNGGAVIGAIAVTRAAPGALADDDIQLLRTFADQAEIAIENARLLNDIREALQQQTATADVLKVISRSVFDLDTVLQTLIDTAVRLTHGSRGTIFLRRDDVLVARAFHSNVPAELRAYLTATPWRLDGDSHMARAARECMVVHVADLSKSQIESDKQVQKRASFGAGLWIPLMREGEVIGVFGVPRDEPIAFSDREIGLVQTFADQAVIAIENARLFDEVRARTRDLSEALQQQTATADVLKVISRSAFDLQSVLDTLVSSAADLIGAHSGNICMRDGDGFRYKAFKFIESERALAEYLRTHPVVLGRGSIAGRTILSGKVEQIPDIREDQDYRVPLIERGFPPRALVGVPLHGKDGLEGVFILSRLEPGPFAPRQIEILQTFADQAVIAIENTRLFDEVQARTRELAASLDNLRKAQDRLVASEKLASLGQLTAGIAHEIKNPLNFVNNFSGLSRELLGELRELLAKAKLVDEEREEADELIGLVASNLDKVVTHGKRADSIVKNMLMHSREGSGERTSVNVNAMVEEALNLAYHGARAEKPGFNVTIERSLDPSAGAADLYPQEITRVLLNLISNGFYATTKREANTAYEPTITASTRDLGDSVEISIRDNGTGIPEEVKAKMFNPFFTTKPAGEGTGLGLSLSHDIVVKQHGGTLEVATEPGGFTEFTILLPRSQSAS